MQDETEGANRPKKHAKKRYLTEYRTDQGRNEYGTGRNGRDDRIDTEYCCEGLIEPAIEAQ